MIDRFVTWLAQLPGFGDVGQGACEEIDRIEAGLDRSVTGGYVQRGTRISGLIGWYIFGDFISGKLLAIRGNSAA